MTASIRSRAAIVTAGALFLLAVLGAVANFVLLPDPSLLGGAVLAFTAVAMLDIVVACGLYTVLAPVDERVAKLSAWFRLAYAAALVPAVGVLVPAIGSGDANAAVRGFQGIWDVALMVFGVHLVLVGVLLLRAPVAFALGLMTRLLGVLVAVAGLGYVADGVLSALAPGSTLSFATFTFFGEVLLIVWLIVVAARGLLVERQPAEVRAAA